MKKSANGTKTAMGFIPHALMHGLECPVRLSKKKDSQGVHFPEIKNRSLVYALPNGGCFMLPMGEIQG